MALNWYTISVVSKFLLIFFNWQRIRLRHTSGQIVYWMVWRILPTSKAKITRGHLEKN